MHYAFPYNRKQCHDLISTFLTRPWSMLPSNLRHFIHGQVRSELKNFKRIVLGRYGYLQLHTIKIFPDSVCILSILKYIV